MKTKFGFFLLMLFVLTDLSDCKKEGSPLVNEEPTLNSPISQFVKKPLKIAIIGGLSYLDPSLMVDCLSEGSDFMNNISEDNVIEEFCKPILDEVIPQILAEKPDLLLIPGELSYNGEKISHEAVARILKDISKQEIKVFVIPGNKDINNPSAKAYYGNSSASTLTITDEEFVKLYNDFGYKDPISRDPNSLSYLSQATNKVWILGIDSRKYPISKGGLIKPETMEWIKYWLAKAKEENVTVLPLCHFNVIEPFLGTANYAGAYVINNHTIIENDLTDAGLRVMFTATVHDIVSHSHPENTLYNISTGLLLIPPFQFRLITIDQNSMKVETSLITSIDAVIPGGINLLDYSKSFLQQRLIKMYTTLFTGKPFNLPLEMANSYSPHFARATAAFYAGDEIFPIEEQEFSQSLPEPYKSTFIGFYTDLPPEDVQYTIPMQ